MSVLWLAIEIVLATAFHFWMMGISLALYPRVLAHPKLPYPHGAQWIANTRLQRWLGIDLANRIITGTRLRRLNPRAYLAPRGVAGLAELADEMRKTELCHACAFVFGSLAAAAAAGAWGAEPAIVLMATNGLLNGYPIAVQQKNGARVRAVLRRREHDRD